MIIFSTGLAEIIYEDARNKYPYECCGILLGKRDGSGCRRVKEIYRTHNSVEGERKKKHFLIPTDVILYTEYIAAKRNYEIVGFYHSHTDCEAIASEEDRSFAIPGISYPIVSVQKGQIKDMLSWEKRWSDDHENFMKEIIEIRD